MPAIFYSHPRLIQLIQQRQPEYDDALDAVQDAQTLVRDMKQGLMQAEQQLAQKQATLQQENKHNGIIGSWFESCRRCSALAGTGHCRLS